jgi:hypothetical protein
MFKGRDWEQMEKEQIMTANMVCDSATFEEASENAERYYNRTYKQQKNGN